MQLFFIPEFTNAYYVSLVVPHVYCMQAMVKEMSHYLELLREVESDKDGTTTVEKRGRKLNEIKMNYNLFQSACDSIYFAIVRFTLYYSRL